MRHLISASAIACLVLLNETTPVIAEATFNPANTISLEAGHRNSFRNFAPELAKMRDRVVPPNTEFGLRVSEIEPGLFFVTDMIYQSAFLVTTEGVVVFDAPPSIGEHLRAAIEMSAPDVPITHLIMSHGHGDHNGGGFAFADIPDLKIIASREVAETLEKHPLPGVLRPTETFNEMLDLTIGGIPIKLQNAHFHAEDVDTMIYLPEQKFLMAVDTIAPGEVPFMNFGATTDVRAYLDSFDTLLAYDFEHFLSGHVSVLGTRDDVIAARDYSWDVRDTVAAMMPGFLDRVMKGMNAMEFQNGNLAYRYAMESIRDDCAAQIIERWKQELSVADVWADSHCETTVLHFIMH